MSFSSHTITEQPHRFNQKPAGFSEFEYSPFFLSLPFVLFSDFVVLWAITLILTRGVLLKTIPWFVPVLRGLVFDGVRSGESYAYISLRNCSEIPLNLNPPLSRQVLAPEQALLLAPD